MASNKLKTGIGVSVALVVVYLFFWSSISGSLPSSQGVREDDLVASVANKLDFTVSQDQFIELIPGLKVADVVIGQGDPITRGEMAAVHYVGRLSDGTQFDNSVSHGSPIAFEYGSGQLIVGFERGIEGMRVGGVRRIIIDPELGYGVAGVTLPDGTVVIPPNAELTFDILLVGVGE